MRVFFFLAIMLVHCFASGPTVAAQTENWKVRGDINWTHPDGRKLKGRYANAKVDDDILSLIRADGGLYLQFRYNSKSKLLKRGAKMFIETNLPSSDQARFNYFKRSPIVKPNKKTGGGAIVQQLTPDDISQIHKYSGNIIGTTYSIRKTGNTRRSQVTYGFSGVGVSAALSDLGFRPSGSAPKTAKNKSTEKKSRRSARAKSTSKWVQAELAKINSKSCTDLTQTIEKTCRTARWQCNNAQRCSGFRKKCKPTFATKNGCLAADACFEAEAKARDSSKYCKYAWSGQDNDGFCYLRNNSRESFSYNCPGYGNAIDSFSDNQRDCQGQRDRAVAHGGICHAAIERYNSRCGKAVKMIKPRLCSY